MNTFGSSLSDIYNFRPLGDRLATGGQPTEAQFRKIREAGFEAVINLALPTSDNALSNEGAIVTGFGMSYAHIPVDFKEPKGSDFHVFCGLMSTFEGCRVFVHCAANMRVSVFIFLHRVLYQDVGVVDAEKDLHAIWQPDKPWARFIRTQLASKRNAA